MKETNFKYFPDTDHRFFLYEPEGNGFMYFKTAEERDAASHDVIHGYCDDGWMEMVSQVIAGEITHHTVRCDVEMCPKREDCDSDEDYEDALAEYGDDYYRYKCNYKLAPLDVEDEPVPKEEWQP